MKKRLVIFASGNGSNAQNLIEYFNSGDLAVVTRVLSNKKEAKVLERAKNLDVPTSYFTRNELYDQDGVLKLLLTERPDLIILAGFLWMFPAHILAEFPNRVINIHPALLPKYGGKGMYGSHVHDSVVENNETETGITIHYVNEKYDEGAIIFQAKTNVTPADTAETVAEKVHALEYAYFPKVVEDLLLKMPS